jgi:hypothetical protein
VLGFISICSGVALLHNSNSQPHPEPKKEDTEKQMFRDDEKISLEEPVIVRKKSVFQMFENEQQQLQDHEHGTHTPGAADLFPAPFSGISRYTSTTKRSQSIIITRNRLQSISNNSNATIAKTEDASSPRSINNMTLVEDSDKWSAKDYHHPGSPAGQYSESFAHSLITTEDDENQQGIPSMFKRNHSTSVSSSHRAQNELDPLSSFRMKINGGERDDREGLVDDH